MQVSANRRWLDNVALTLVVVVAAGAWAQPAGSESRTMEDLVVIIDFRTGGEAWPSINDVVMGGVSRSTMVIEQGAAVFSGDVSLENNGGFASVRSRPGDHDMSGFAGVVLRVRGDGKRYALRLRTTDALDGVSYQAKIQPQAGEWSDLTVPFSDFEPVFRGRRVASHPPLDPAAIRTFGFLIAEGQEGPFRLEIQWITGLEP